MVQIYLANALGFASLGAQILEQVKEKLNNAGFAVHEPFEHSKDEGAELKSIMATNGDIKSIRIRSREISMKIGKKIPTR